MRHALSPGGRRRVLRAFSPGGPAISDRASARSSAAQNSSTRSRGGSASGASPAPARGDRGSTARRGCPPESGSRLGWAFRRQTGSRPGRRRREAQATATSTSTVRTVSGRPRSARTSRQPMMASLMFARASCSVRPWLTQPVSPGIRPRSFRLVSLEGYGELHCVRGSISARACSEEPRRATDRSRWRGRVPCWPHAGAAVGHACPQLARDRKQDGQGRPLRGADAAPERGGLRPADHHPRRIRQIAGFSDVARALGESPLELSTG